MTITEQLLAIETTHSYFSATQHKFLTAAGNGTLNSDLLGFWLYQDRIYAAHAYPRFIGTLISKIPFSILHPPDSSEELKNQRLLKTLTYALDNVVREASFFQDMSKKWNLDLTRWKLRRATKEYTAEMARIANQCSSEEGLVFLWAMEKIYYDSWTYVKTVSDREGTSLAENAVNEFVSNWTNDEFLKFVNELAEIVNDLPMTETLWHKSACIWDRAVELEKGFWPEIGEET